MRLRTVSKVVAALVSRSTGPADHAATQAAVQHACNPADWSALPAFCNTTLQMDDRINDLIERLTIDEKVTLLGSDSGGVPSQGIQSYQWWSEALHGVGFSPGVKFEDPTPFATSFPQVVTTSHSFNLKLVRAVGGAVGTEGRAFANVGHAGLTFWAPNINIFRDPRWGRGQETPGEDPLYSGHYAAAVMRGMQGGEDPRYLRVSGCCKHFAAYSVENLYNGTSRHDFNALVTAQDMADTYLPAFSACVRSGGASSIMCSYNSINGVPACADYDLLNGRARGEWGFDGYVTSDCGAIDDVQKHHNFTDTPEATCAATLKAGTDLDCGEFYHKNMVAAHQSGAVTDQDLNAAVQHLLRVQFRLGLFDPPEQQVYTKYGVDLINSPAHRLLALEAARQGMVLLKNRKADALPLDASSLSSLAVIGPHANASLAMLGTYNGLPQHITTPIEGLRRYVPGAELVEGCAINSTDRGGFAAAVDAARRSDATVVLVGLDKSIEDEGRDRTSIALPGQQLDLIREVAAAAKGPVVVVLIAGGAVDLSAAKDDDNVDAILFAGYPGQSGGQAIAETVFGEHNPAGRLTQTFYRSDYTAKVAMADMSMRPSQGNGQLGRTYRFFRGGVVWPFGYGLSYSSFPEREGNCSDLASLAAAASSSSSVAISRSSSGRQDELDGDEEDEAVTVLHTRGELEGAWATGTSKDKRVVKEVCVEVTNTGARSGRHVLLAFLTPPAPQSDAQALQQPLSSLAAFASLPPIKPGHTRAALLRLTQADFQLADETGNFRVVPGQWGLQVGRVKLTINVQ